MRIAFLLALVLFGLTAPAVARACFVASHHWRIVLGESDDGLAILDLPLHRQEREVPCKLSKKDRRCHMDPFDEPDGRTGGSTRKPAGTRLEIFWAGMASVGLLTANGQEPKPFARLGSVNSINLYRDVKSLLARARIVAGRLRGYKPFALPVQDFCDYSRACGRYELRSDANGQLSLRLSEANQATQVFPISLPGVELERVAAGGGLGVAVHDAYLLAKLIAAPNVNKRFFGTRSWSRRRARGRKKRQAHHAASRLTQVSLLPLRPVRADYTPMCRR